MEPTRWHESLQQQYFPVFPSIWTIWHGYFSWRTVLANVANGRCCRVSLGVAQLQSCFAVVLADVADQPDFTKLFANVAKPLQLLADVTHGRRCWRQRIPNVPRLQPSFSKLGWRCHASLLSGFTHLVTHVT
jgi:hypothetical protein